MFVCICKGIRKSDIETLARKGGQGSEDIKKLTGAGTECGTCELRIQRVLKEIQSNSTSTNISDKEDVAG
ncbi:MAG: (2Fe-2S)-binding protein [Bdellovibrionales bacterium]|nr:(2Fe-2S)-binding protein [Bdellovibrionales bacterium]